MTTKIPSVYRAVFTWVDPIIAAWGAWLFWFDRDTVVRSFIPDSARNPAHDMLFYQLGGHMLGLSFLSAVLLRYTADVGVWKCIMVADWIVDIANLWGTYDALAAQGRLSLGALRWEDWACVGITGTATLIRTLFLLGVGMPKAAAAKPAKRRS